MVLDAVSNFVRGNTDAAVGTDDTTVSVDDASIFPDPETDGEFNVVIWDVNNFPRPDQDGDVEIMRVTARDTTADELTVTRGQEMTSAAAHPEGSAIHLSPTAKMFSDIESTFGDFWDAGTQELTADVNNTNTTTQALEADRANIEKIANSVHSHLIFLGSDDIIYLQNRHGEIVGGGDDSIGVSDNEDLGEILELAVNDLDARNIAISGGGYEIKQPATLDRCHTIFGPGKNRVIIRHGEDVIGEDAITIENAGNDILRWDSIKFDGRDQGDGNEPARWLKTNGVPEILMTNVEMRDADVWALESIDADSPNYLHNCWFINGAGVRFEDANQLIVTGNTFRGETLELEDVREPHIGKNNAMNLNLVDTEFEEVGPEKDFRFSGEQYRNAFEQVNTLQVDDSSTNDILAIERYSSGDNRMVGVRATVVGRDSGTYFMDEIMALAADGGLEVLGSVERNGPDGRTYAVDEDMLTLDLDGGEYNLTIKCDLLWATN